MSKAENSPISDIPNSPSSPALLGKRISEVLMGRETLYLLLTNEARLSEMSPAAQIFGLQDSLLAQQPHLEDLPCFTKLSRSQRVIRELLDTVAQQEDEGEADCLAQLANGELRYCHLKLTPIYKEGQDLLHFLAEITPSDKKSRQSLEKRIEENLQAVIKKGLAPTDFLIQLADLTHRYHMVEAVEVWQISPDAKKASCIHAIGTEIPPESLIQGALLQALINRGERSGILPSSIKELNCSEPWKAFDTTFVQVLLVGDTIRYLMVCQGQASPLLNWDLNVIGNRQKRSQALLDAARVEYERRMTIARFNLAETLAGQASFDASLETEWAMASSHAGILFPALGGQQEIQLKDLLQYFSAEQAGQILDDMAKATEGLDVQTRLYTLEIGEDDIRYYTLRMRSLPPEAGKVRALLVFSDISKEHQLQQNQEELLEKLKRSNRELEQFAYVASHDLQEPLRKIRAFGDLLKVEHGSDPNFGGTDYINRMRAAAGRMQVLIDDLLAYSRISRNTGETRKISLEKVLQEVSDDLKVLREETGAQIEIGPLPQINGKLSQIRQLFQNLLNNAIKFKKPDLAPRVLVRYHEQLPPEVIEQLRPPVDPTDYFVISVEDNGIGFDMKYLEKIFNIFQRLHGISEYKGSGIGLAVCKRSAENHGGTIRAIGIPDQGATFYIFLPQSLLATETLHS